MSEEAVTQDQKDQLAAWIEAGLQTPNVYENKLDYLSKSGHDFDACALGFALVGKVGNAAEARALYQAEAEKFGEGGCSSLAVCLELPLEFVFKVSRLHAHGKSAYEIVALLRSGNFEVAR